MNPTMLGRTRDMCKRANEAFSRLSKQQNLRASFFLECQRLVSQKEFQIASVTSGRVTIP
jgi:hypothetical protein